MIRPGGNRLHRGEARGVCLTGKIITPGDDSAVASKGHAMKLARSDRDVIRAPRNVGLSGEVITPRYEASVVLDGEIEITAGGNRDDARKARRCVRLKKSVVTPCNRTARRRGCRRFDYGRRPQRKTQAAKNKTALPGEKQRDHCD